MGGHSVSDSLAFLAKTNGRLTARYGNVSVYEYEGDHYFIPEKDMSNTPNDCYHRALPGEPTFTMLARDPEFYNFLMKWAAQRQHAVMCGDRPSEDMTLVMEAQELAVKGAVWRKENLWKWRE